MHSVMARATGNYVQIEYRDKERAARTALNSRLTQVLRAFDVEGLQTAQDSQILKNLPSQLSRIGHEKSHLT